MLLWRYGKNDTMGRLTLTMMAWEEWIYYDGMGKNDLLWWYGKNDPLTMIVWEEWLLLWWYGKNYSYYEYGKDELPWWYGKNDYEGMGRMTLAMMVLEEWQYNSTVRMGKITMTVPV